MPQLPASSSRPAHLPRWALWSVATVSVLGAGAAVIACTRAPLPELGLQLTQLTHAPRAIDPTSAPQPQWASRLARVERAKSATTLAPLSFAASIAPAQGPGLWPDAGGGAPSNGCPRNMARLGGYCIDRYEASLVERLPGGLERPHPYFQNPGSLDVRAVSEPNVYPQAHISGREAAAACAASGKRLCKVEEWRNACQGSQRSTYPYGNERQRGTCNDHGRAPLAVVFKGDRTVYSSYEKMNDPGLNQVEGTLARAGEHEECTNEHGVYDMVGNVHEWVDDPRGKFLGGYYLDTTQNGNGCNYTTDRHRPFYHDYSTGFRCCADAD